MGVRDSTPPILYAHLYPDQASWDNYLQREHAFYMARQERKTDRWKAKIGVLERERLPREKEQ
jgi:hypothetical protein